MTTPAPPPSGQMYPEQSQAVLALVLSILHFVVCPVLGPVAWYLANGEMRAIAEGRRPPENMSMANAAKIIGIIGTILLGLGIVLFLLFVLIGGFAALTQGI